MGTLIKLMNRDNDNETEYYSKTIHKHIGDCARGFYIRECNLNTNIKSITDINRLHEFLDTLEIALKTK